MVKKKITYTTRQKQGYYAGLLRGLGASGFKDRNIDKFEKGAPSSFDAGLYQGYKIRKRIAKALPRETDDFIKVKK